LEPGYIDLRSHFWHRCLPTTDVYPMRSTESGPNTAMEFPNPSPQLQTVLAFLKAVSDQNPDDTISHLTEDAEYHWVTPGFDALGPRVKNKEQTKAFFTQVSGTFVKDFKVNAILERAWADTTCSISSKTTSRCRARLSCRYVRHYSQKWTE
jgi:hypothetical protein